MPRGELLTKLPIWLALAAYTLAATLLLLARPHANSSSYSRLATTARNLWTLGCAFFLLHVACAFHYYHHWSHTAAYVDTARQTAAMTGVRWGGGLYLNYLFALAWMFDVAWWWLAPASFAHRSPRLTIAWHSFFFFMVFNGTVVFAHAPMRWFGALLCATLAILWWRTRPPSRTNH